MISIIVVLAMAGCAWGADAPASRLTCAVLTDLSGGQEQLLALIEAQVLASGQAGFVERNAIRQILGEQTLGALLGPEAVARRAELGRLLKADVLVLLRGGKGESPYVELVICETRRGLRLWNWPVPVSDDAQADAAAVVKAFEQALERHHRPIERICAVPPFVSNDLTYDFDHLKGAYAKLIERMLLDRPGVLVVEMAEAQAVARELAIGGEKTIQRELPLYVLGEYRHEGSGEQRRVRINLTVKWGEVVVGEPRRLEVLPEEAPAAIREAVNALVDGELGAPVRRPDTHAEARQLLERARASRRQDDLAETAALAEASLLLEPQQEEARGLAAATVGTLANRAWQAGIAHAHRDPRTVERLQAAVALHLRSLEHLKVLLSMPHEPRAETLRSVTEAIYLPPYLFAPKPGDGPGVAALLHQCQQQARDVIVGAATEWAHSGRPQAAQLIRWAYAGYPEHRQAWRKLMEDLRQDPAQRSNLRIFLGAILQEYLLQTAEGIQFLDQLAMLPDEEIRAQVAELRRREAAVKAHDQVWADRWMASTRPATDPVGVEPDVLYRPVQLPRHQGYLPATEGVDVLWSEHDVYLMTRPGKLERVWGPKRSNAFLNQVCYDGRYIWMTAQESRQAPILAVLDPQSRQVLEVTREDGLLLLTENQTNSEWRVQTLAITPLSPGRILVIGSFGRTWIAIASFDPKTGKSVRTFHEAKEKVDAADAEACRRTTVAFSPQLMLAVPEATAPEAGAAHQRVIVVRGDASSGAPLGNALLIDPQALSVQVLEENLVTAGPGTHVVRNGAIYVQGNGSMENALKGVWNLYRCDFARRKWELAAEGIYEGAMPRLSIAFLPGRVVVAGTHLWAAPSETGPFRRLSGVVPGVSVMANQLPALRSSHHYGLLVDVGEKTYAIEFRDTGRSPATTRAATAPGER